jgi:TonB family protein
MSPVRRDRSRHVLALGLGGALFGHAIGLALEDRWNQPAHLRVSVRGPDEALAAAPAPIDREPVPATLISMGDIDLAALPLVVVPGPGDAAAWAGENPLPAASADLPGATAADRGGGAEGGAATWTGRRDPDQTALRAQLWNGADDYRTPRADLDQRAATSEAIARAPERAYGDRQRRKHAEGGAEVASVEGSAVPVHDADAIVVAGTTESAPAREDGATRTARESALVDHGDTAVDVERHGTTGDDVAVAAASDQRDPDPYDLTPPRSGGDDGEGVRGKHTDDGALADGRGHGTGASRTKASEGKGGSSVFATRTDPYLRTLLKKLDKEIVFPHDLALDLRSGRVIAVITVAADGKVKDIGLQRSSGFEGFDHELMRALEAIAPLGRVPESLLSGRRSLRVMVPYTFRNPMIR